MTGSDITEAPLGRLLRLLHGYGLAQMGHALSDAAFLQPDRRAHGGAYPACHVPGAAGSVIAGALNFIGSDALYGRNWGAIEHHPCLHFEACYYQAIEFAIAHKLARVEAGAQGPHKLARGYVPEATHSLHYLADPRLSRAVADYLEQERAAIGEEQEFLAAMHRFGKAIFNDPHPARFSATLPIAPRLGKKKAPLIGGYRLDHHDRLGIGKSSVKVTWMRATWPGGVMRSSCALAPPVSSMVGRPEGSLTTPMSRQKTPRLKPVPSALEQASLAAKRLA